MKMKLCGLLIGILFCVGIATAGSISETCLPGGAVLGGAGTPPLVPTISGDGVCAAFTIPSLQTLTSIVVSIQGDYSGGAGAGTGITNTLNWTYTLTDEGGGSVTAAGFAGTSTEQVQGNSSSGPFTFNGTGCAESGSSNTEFCTTNVGISSGVIDAFAITAQGSWAAGSIGLNPAGVEDFNISVTFNYLPTASIPEPASLLLVGSGLIGLGVLARRRRRG